MLKSRERPRARHFLLSAAAMSDPSKSQPASTAAPANRAKRGRNFGFDVPGIPPVPNFGEESPMPEPKRHKASAKGASPQLTQELPSAASRNEERNTPTASGQDAAQRQWFATQRLGLASHGFLCQHLSAGCFFARSRRYACRREGMGAANIDPCWLSFSQGAALARCGCITLRSALPT